MMRGTQRKVRRVANTQQRSLFGKPSNAGAERSGAAVPRSRVTRFLPDNPDHLYLGEQRLDRYLEQQGLGWVLWLREVLQSLDYEQLCARYSGRGRRPYHPRTLVSLIVYGVLLGQSSLRAIEALARRDVGAWWLCGGQQPDHSTIGDFIRCNAEVLSAQFSTGTVGKLVQRFELKAGLVAGDGTVIEAAVSRWGVLRVEALREQQEQAQEAAEQSVQEEGLAARAEKLGEACKVAEQRSEKRTAKGKAADTVGVSPRDPEAVVQPRKDKVYRPSYKPSVLVHESGLIVGQAVHPSSETAVVPSLLDQHVQAFGCDPITALFDAGYCSNELLRLLCERNIDVLCPSGKVVDGHWRKQESGARFGKSSFRYDESTDTYWCLAGEPLRAEYAARERGLRYVRYRAAAAACARCPLRSQCTASERARTLKRYAGEEYREAVQRVLEQPAARARYRKRMPLAERPTAEVRERLKFTRFRRLGTAGARVEFSLCVIALNLKWAVGREIHRTAGSQRSIFAILVGVRGASGACERLTLHFLAILLA